jgi:hypothetical protein
MEIPMKKILIAIAVAGAFAAPVAAQMSPGADKTTGGGNAADRPANQQAQPVAPVPQGGAITSGSNAADRKAGEPKSGAGATAPNAFDALDRNKDGHISRDEAKDAPWANRFSELDKDNDDRLSRSEFEAMHSSGAAGASGKPGAPLNSGSNAADRKPNAPKQ